MGANDKFGNIPPAESPTDEGVGEKKSKANASLVRARSRGVAVPVNLGRRIMPSCVSNLSPKNNSGKLNATMTTPTTTARTNFSCTFTLLFLLSKP